MHRSLATVLTLLPALAAGLSADEPAKAKDSLALSCGQKEFLTHEPILVGLQLDGKEFAGLPAEVGDKSALSFEIKPEVKPRKGAKPLPVEASTKESKSRLYDLLEWYEFPAEGAFTIRAVLEAKGKRAASPELKISIRKPDKKDPEWGPVDRLHHVPWSNYITDAFCGDTFDLVKRWPDSKLAKYCHYWNGLHYQHKGEYEKAIESFDVVLEKYRDFPLRHHAQLDRARCRLENLRQNPEKSEVRREGSGAYGKPVNPRARWTKEEQQAQAELITKATAKLAGAVGVQEVLDAQVAAWNKGDLEGFMAGYWKSDDLTFISGDKQTRGWQATLDRYRKKYQGEGKEMGKLSFKDIDIRMVGDDHALVTGRWQLEMKKETPGGLFTLIFHKKKEGWRIIHDHTS